EDGIRDRNVTGVQTCALPILVDVDRFDRKAAELDFLARADLVEDGAGSKAVFLELVLDQTDGQAGRINRHIELFEQVGQRADVRSEERRVGEECGGVGGRGEG